jgi:hypothetical protein
MPMLPFSKRFLRWFGVVAGLLLLGIFVYRTGDALYHNHQLRKDYIPAANASPYQQGTPMEQMDLAVYAPYFSGNSAEPAYTLTHRIPSPVTLQYYEKIPAGGEAPALEIPKGTTITAIPEGTKASAFYETGYGYTSYPTYEKGWRYVRPFQTTETSDAAANGKHYYVKLEALEAVLDKTIEANQPLRAAIRQQKWSISHGKFELTRFVDDKLHQHGAYLSPDLSRQAFDGWSIALLGAIGGLGAGLFRTRLKPRVPRT